MVHKDVYRANRVLRVVVVSRTFFFLSIIIDAVNACIHLVCAADSSVLIKINYFLLTIINYYY